MAYLDTSLNTSAHLATLNAVWESVERNLPTVSKEIAPILECTPFMHTAKTVIKYFPHANSEEWDVLTVIEEKSAYLESACIAVASFLHNLSMAVLYQVAAACSNYMQGTQTAKLEYCQKKYYLKTGFSSVAFLISAGGIFSGKLATRGFNEACEMIKRRVWNKLNAETHSFGTPFMRDNAARIADVVSKLEEYFDVPADKRATNLNERITRAQSNVEIQNIAKEILKREVIKPLFPRRNLIEAITN